MTVADLIAELQRHDQNMLVACAGTYGGDTTAATRVVVYAHYYDNAGENIPAVLVTFG